MLRNPSRERRGRHVVAGLRFQFGRGLGQGVAEVVEGHPLENDTERVGLGSKLGWCRREAAAA